jgi:hypothetical protein
VSIKLSCVYVIIIQHQIDHSCEIRGGYALILLLRIWVFKTKHTNSLVYTGSDRECHVAGVSSFFNR